MEDAATVRRWAKPAASGTIISRSLIRNHHKSKMPAPWWCWQITTSSFLFSAEALTGPSPALHSSVHVLVEPVHEKLRDLSAVFLGHHLMAVAGHADIFQVVVLSFYARLVQPLGHATRVRTVITRLA